MGLFLAAVIAGTFPIGAAAQNGGGEQVITFGSGPVTLAGTLMRPTHVESFPASS